ncbi:MAG: energy transducer TonB [Crocinitomicaceae bacterium]|jgi:protein TonB|tara:strand:+ start:2237 stop:2905 length:669 start_codon:yes stop_codon:yes gene_type:complete
MEIKKNSEVDVDRVKSSFLMIGLNYVAGLTLAAFTFQSVKMDDDLSDSKSRQKSQEYQAEEEEKPEPEEIEEPPAVVIQPPIVEEIQEEENIDEPPPPDVTPPEPPPIAEEEVITVVEEIVEFPDVEAGFPGGAAAMIKWINDNVDYPQTSIEMNEQGRVFLSFVVEKDGSITNVKIERGISPDLDKEAKRVVRKMPKWTAGEAAGRAVRARCRLPINFQLN